MLIILSGYSGRVSSVKKKASKQEKAIDNLRRSSEVENAEALGGQGIKFSYDPPYGCVLMRGEGVS